MTFASTSVKHTPALDEGSFQQLLAAAYVVQQHNDNLRAKESRLETSQVLAQIAEIQSLARTCALDVAGVAALVADRLRKMTDANGVSIGLVTDGYLDCVAESGLPAKIPGSSIASHSLVATERLKTGKIFESDDAQNDIRLDIDLSRDLKTGSLIAAPVHPFGELSGLLEVRWNRAKAFRQNDARACEMMAGLITSTLERSARQQTPLVSSDPIEVATGSPATENPGTGTSEATGLPALDPDSRKEPLPDRCRVCGQTFGADEVFCGNCSMPRVAGGPAEGLQSKWASMWYMQQAHDVRQPRDANSPQRSETRWLVPASVENKPVEKIAPISAPVPEPTRSLWTHPNETAAASPHAIHGSTGQSSSPNLNALLDENEGNTMRRVSPRTGLFPRHPIAVVIGSVAMFLLLTIWAFSPAPGGGQITRFESLLVELGLAEVPSRPAFASGRPDAQVWVDVHTALYYCEGSELYGKTPEGRFSTQQEAQQDQFGSATQVPCK